MQAALDAKRALRAASKAKEASHLKVEIVASAPALVPVASAPEPPKQTEAERRAEAKARYEAESRRKEWAFRNTLHPTYRECTFQNYEVSDDRQRAAIEKITQYLKFLVYHRGQTISGLVLLGTVGTGKDFLLSAAGAKAAERGHLSVQWKNGQRLFQEWRARINEEVSEDRFINRLAEPDVLIVSDALKLTREPLENYDRQLLYGLLEVRQGRNKPTWFSLNVESHDDMKTRMGGAVTDRIGNRAQIVNCRWPSYREKETDFSIPEAKR